MSSNTQNVMNQDAAMVGEPAVVLDELALFEDERSDREVYTESFFQESFEGAVARGVELTVFFNEHVMSADRWTSLETWTVGEALANDFMLEHGTVGGRFVLVERVGEQHMVRVGPGMGGQVLLGDEVFELGRAIEAGLLRPLGGGCHGLMLARGAAARVDIGESSFLVRRAMASEAPTRGLMRPDMRLAAFIAGSVALHAMFVFIALYSPPEAQAFNLDGMDARDRFISQVIKAEQEEREREAPELLAMAGEAGGEGADAAAGEVGKAGRPDAPDVRRKAANKGPRDNAVPEFARDRAIVKQRGVFTVMEDSMARSWTSGRPIEGMDPVTALADNTGSVVGDGLGDFALGDRRGLGPGAGGQNDHSFVITTLTTSKRCCGPDSGPPGIDRDAMLDERKDERLPDVIPQAPTITGSLDKSLIQQVIRKHRREIKYCYEQGLARSRDLSGRVVVKFTIGSTGGVAASFIQSSTLGDKQVEACVAGKVRNWIFPEPKGNGIVIVSYPFRFAPQGR